MNNANLKSTPTANHRLRSGTLGTTAIAFFVISAAAPLTGVAGGFPLGMLLGNGVGIPFAFLLITILLLLFSVGYTQIAHHITNAGAFYAFVAQGFNGRLGGAAAYVALLAYNAMSFGLYGLFGAVASGTMGDLFGIALPWYVYSFLALAIIGVMGYRKIELSLKLLAVLVVLEFLVVMVLGLTIAGSGGAGGADGTGIGMSSFTWTALLSGTPTLGFLLCFSSFMGFESTTIYAEEAKQPKISVPRATYAAVLVIGIFYSFAAWMMVEGTGATILVETISNLKNPDGTPNPSLFIYTLTDKYGGPALTLVTQLLFISSIFAALQAFHNATARYFYVLGREGLLPLHLGRTHERHQSPHSGSLLQTILAAIVVLVFVLFAIDPVLGLFTWLTTLATLAIILIMATVSFAVIGYGLHNPHLHLSPWRSKLAPALSGAFMIVIAFMVTSHFDIMIGADPATPGSALLVFGLPLLVPLAAVIGFVVASRLASSDPKAYAAMGKSQID